jgi:hypothetical protein
MRFGQIHSIRFARLPSIPWGRFAGELATIILGVFLALVGQEWVNGRLESRQIQFTELDLRHEIMTSAQSAYQRLALHDCLQNDIATLATALNRDGDQWQPVERASPIPAAGRALTPVYGAPVRPWNSAAWQTAIASNSLTSMPIERVIAYVHVYEAIEKLHELQNIEFNHAARLSHLSIPRQINRQIRADMLADLGQIDASAALMANVSEALLHEISKLHYALTKEERTGFAARIDGAMQVRGRCVTRPPLPL